MKQADLLNERWAMGYLAEVSELKEFNNNGYFNFLVRHIKKGKFKIRVTDYYFSGNQIMYDNISTMPLNCPVAVKFEIKTEEASFEKAGEKIQFYKTKLKATDAFEYDGEHGGEWIWKVKDWQDMKEVRDVIKDFPNPPLIERAKRRKSGKVKDFINSKGEFKQQQNEEPEDKLPF